MKKSAIDSKREGRIVNVSSVAHKVTYKEGICFDSINDQSGNGLRILTSRICDCALEDGVDITANSLHPGGIAPNLFQNSNIMSGIAMISLVCAARGAATTCCVALHPQVKDMSGENFVYSNSSKARTKATDTKFAKKLWDYSMNLTE